jgi:hypothetical protein
MPHAPAFFVPEVAPEKQEFAYADLARWASRPIPNLDHRIYSIIFLHDGGEWTATVGRRLHGVRHRRRRSHGTTVEHTEPLSDSAIVLAIFAGTYEGDTFVVVTNEGLAENTRSTWENPFYAGRPRSVQYFSTPEDDKP